MYAQINGVKTVDDALRALEMEAGLDPPGADLLFSDPYAILVSGVESARYLGVAYVDGVECHHVAFREDKVDWQLWIRAGDAPLPMKYVITSKWVLGAPQHAVRLKNWNTSPQFPADQFTIAVPEGAPKIGTLAVSEMGEILVEETE